MALACSLIYAAPLTQYHKTATHSRRQCGTTKYQTVLLWA